jgi:hypothetical protein
MYDKVYAIATVGRFQLFVGDVSRITVLWPPKLALLNSGKHPHTALQEEWKRTGNQRRFTFHTRKEIEGNHEIIGIEHLE